jgi:hypothetical protein
MFSVILATLITMQAAPVELYKFEFAQYGMAEGYVRLSIIPQGDFKWGKDYNAVLTLRNSKNVVLSRTRFTNKGGDFSQEGAAAFVDIPFKVTDFDEHVITGTISFLVCNKTRCTPQRNVKVQFVVVGEVGC